MDVRPFNQTLLSIAIFRSLLGAFIVVFYSPEKPYIGIAALIIGQLSDHVDGFIARRWSTPTEYGYFQDSISDKLFQFGALLVCVREFELASIAVWLVISRDLILLSVRALSRNLSNQLKAFKSLSVIFALLLRAGIFILFLTPVITSAHFLHFIGNSLIYTSSLLGLLSTLYIVKSSNKQA